MFKRKRSILVAGAPQGPPSPCPPPDNATGNFTKSVLRIPVKIKLDPRANLEARNRAGMSLTATIDPGGDARRENASDPEPSR